MQEAPHTMDMIPLCFSPSAQRLAQESGDWQAAFHVRNAVASNCEQSRPLSTAQCAALPKMTQVHSPTSCTLQSTAQHSPARTLPAIEHLHVVSGLRFDEQLQLPWAGTA